MNLTIGPTPPDDEAPATSTLCVLTSNGVRVYVDPWCVVGILPAVDPQGRPVIGMCAVVMHGGLQIVASVSAEAARELIEKKRREALTARNEARAL